MKATWRSVLGFTLIEIMVGLVVGGMALASAAMLVHGLGARGQALNEATTTRDRDANARRLVRSLLANLDFRPADAAAVVGDAQRVRLRSWCRTPAGWMAPCQATLYFERRDGSVALLLTLAAEGRSPLALALLEGSSGRLRYLVDPANGGSWSDTWADITVPAAVAFIVDKDTLFAGVWSGG